jgi:hypothetical protein
VGRAVATLMAAVGSADETSVLRTWFGNGVPLASLLWITTVLCLTAVVQTGVLVWILSKARRVDPHWVLVWTIIGACALIAIPVLTAAIEFTSTMGAGRTGVKAVYRQGGESRGHSEPSGDFGSVADHGGFGPAHRAPPHHRPAGRGGVKIRIGAGSARFLGGLRDTI